MAGKIKSMIDDIIEKRSKGNATIANTTKTKIRLKGIDIDRYTATSEDDPVVITRLESLYKELVQ